MEIIRVHSQEEFNAIPDDCQDQICIEFGTKDNPAIVDRRFYYPVIVDGEYCVIAKGYSSIYARDDSSVSAYDYSSVVAMDNSNVIALERGIIFAYDNSFVEARGRSCVNAYDRSLIVAHYRSCVKSFDESTVECFDESSVEYFNKKKDDKLEKLSDLFESICKELHDLYERKNKDYGDSFHLSFVEEGMAMSRIRIGDKFNRFKTLTKGEQAEVKDESIRDTLIDLANYAIMTIMEIDKEENHED